MLMILLQWLLIPFPGDGDINNYGFFGIENGQRGSVSHHGHWVGRFGVSLFKPAMLVRQKRKRKCRLSFFFKLPSTVGIKEHTNI